MAAAASIEAVLAPLLDLFEAAAGQAVALHVETHAGGGITRYAFHRGHGVVVATPPGGGRARQVDTPLRASVALSGANGEPIGCLEAAALGGKPFDTAARDALAACARVIEQVLPAQAPAVQRGDTALVDADTGLPNRAALVGELERMLARAQRDDMTVFAVCVSLAGLDDVQHGVDGGVQALAACLGDSVRGGDLVARTGRHEFAVVGSIPRATADASAAVVLERLNARCGTCVRVPRARIEMGFAVARVGEFDPQTLLADAEENLLA